jgi:hypothetical protein
MTVTQSGDGSRRRHLRADGIDVRSTLAPFGVSRADPTHRWWADGFARAVITPDGPGTIRFRWCRDGVVDVDAWGQGSDWLVDHAPGWIGAHDPVHEFRTAGPPALRELWRRRRPFRLGRSAVVWQELLFTIVGQRVTSVEAGQSWRRIVMAWGEPAPGPLGLVLPPTPDEVASRTYVDFHRFNVERRRADAMLVAARRWRRLEEAADLPVDQALTRLSSLPGLGQWTATATATASHGDPDTVIIGDYGLPTMVSYAFTGRVGRVSDDRMLELLAPYAGHRWRVVRLLSLAGMHPPRRAPRVRNPRISAL